MKKIPAVAFATMALFGFAGGAQAGVVDDTSLASPGVYFGSGNSNTHFTVSTTGSVELGLSAITRFVGPVVPTGDVYNVTTGPTGVSGQSGSAWGFVFSVNLNADGNGSLSLSDITTKLSLNDVGLGSTGGFDVLLISDNAEFGLGGVCPKASLCGPASGFSAVQNSEALSFSLVAAGLGDSGYDIDADDTYIFTLEAFNKAGASLGTNTITVVAGKGAAIPEPVTLSLFGAGVAGMAAMRRRKKAQKL